ncbi:MAG TPA: CBS domain-containing protein [Cyclobacteriaceae bacterium]|nr:CBS domain-containing protein [Cyclobacteriaceae bacterium]
MTSTVKDFLTQKDRTVWTIDADSTVYDALVKMSKKGIGALVVLDKKGKVSGIFSERDYARKVVLYGKSSKESTVSELMTKEITFAKPENSIEECMTLLSKKHIRHLPVLDGDELVGVITIRDVLKKVIEDQQLTIQNLEDYIYGRSYGAQSYIRE